MALALLEDRSGFRYTDILLFIREEVLHNGGDPDFYLTFSERRWEEIEDQLQAILTNPWVPRTHKRACAWSALALSVRVAARQREQHAHMVRQLQEQVEEQEMASWALASQLQCLGKERNMLVSQLRQAREDLKQAQNQLEAVRWQLLQAERRLRVESPLQGLKRALWPPNVKEQNQVLPKMWQRSLHTGSQKEETQMASTTGVVYMPGLPDPQMPPGVMYSPGMCPVVVSQANRVFQCDKEGPVGPCFIKPSEYSWSQEDPTSEKQQPGGQVPSLPKAPETSCEAEEYLVASE